MSSGTFTTLDSGQRETFGTGSVRDTREGKGRFDLISTIGLRRLAGLYERGASKYGDRNWEKGQPLGRYLDSAMRHLICLMEGKKDEDHAAAVSWNMFGFMHTAEKINKGELPPELDDIRFCDIYQKSMARQVSTLIAGDLDAMSASASGLSSRAYPNT